MLDKDPANTFRKSLHVEDELRPSNSKKEADNMEGHPLGKTNFQMN